jgi:hypothetical protein
MRSPRPRSDSDCVPQVGFDYSQHLRLVCRDMIARLPELSHIDLSRVAICCSQARKLGTYGVHASLTPMRFADGRMTEKRRGRFYATQRLLSLDGHDYLYILTVMLPRFADGSLDEKLTTLLHELWHISPDFNGDIRRHAGRCHVHTGSQKNYDARMLALARRWLEAGPPSELYDFLQCSFGDLRRRYGHVTATRIRRPKLIPVSASQARSIEQRQAH